MDLPVLAPAVDGDIVDTDAYEIGRLYRQSNESLVMAVEYRIERGGRLKKKKTICHTANG